MRPYDQYCPVAKATEIIAERWTPLIIRELLYGARRFNDLERGLPGIPRSLLSERLRRLEAAGVVARAPGPDGRGREYQLTRAGLELKGVVDALGHWGARWAFADPRPEELDPDLLLWWMRRRVRRERLPPRRVVVEIEIRGGRAGRYWLVMDPTGVSVCRQHPGFEADLLVTADIAACYRVLFSRLTLAAALRERAITVQGPAPLIRDFATWWTWYPVPAAADAATSR